MVPHAPIPLSLQPPTAPIATTHQFETRIHRLEQQQFQEGVNAQFRSIHMSQSFQHLQQQVYHMQQVIAYDMPVLRYQVQALEAKLDRKENDDCTRSIQLERRSQEQRLQSAMENPNLMRIYTSISTPNDATLEQNSLRRAEQMEALAALLRRRVHRGGAAYLLEAEDAEAWATKVREDTKLIGQPEVGNELSKSHDSEAWSKMASPPEAIIANAPQENETTHENLDDWQITAPWNTIHKDAASPAQSVSAKGSDMHVHAFKCSKPPSLSTSDPLCDTIDKEVAVTPQSNSAKGSEIHIRTSECPKPPSLSSSAVSIKIESFASDVSSVQVKAIPELQTKKLALHLRYAAQRVQESKEPTLDQETEVTTNDKIIQTQEDTIKNDVIQTEKVAEAQVPSYRLPPHRRFYKRAAPPTPEPDTEFTNQEVEESTASGLVVPRAVSDVFKIEAPPAREKAISVKNQVSPTQEKATSVKDTPSTGSKQDESTSTLDLNTAIWQPSYLKDLPTLPPSELDQIPPSQKMHTFSRTFILNHLGGTRWLPSFYSIPPSELSLLPGRGFYLLEDTTEPLAPTSPGHHGSLITPILRLPESDNLSTPKPESMTNAPLFIKRGDRYVYLGMYTYLRSDRLDLERYNALIPAYLKDYWAAQLTTPKRPKWVTEALKQHLRPPLTYSRPSSSASEDAITTSLSSHHQALEAWHRDTSLLTSFLRPSNILSAFSAPDTGADIPGLRFWCLGLKCEGWDKEFYDMMCREEKIWEQQGKKDGEREREERKEMLRMLGKGKPVKW